MLDPPRPASAGRIYFSISTPASPASSTASPASQPRQAGTHTHTHTHSTTTQLHAPRVPAPHQSSTLSFSQTLPRKSCPSWLGTLVPTLGYQLLFFVKHFVCLTLFLAHPACTQAGTHTHTAQARARKPNPRLSNRRCLEHKCSRANPALAGWGLCHKY